MQAYHHYHPNHQQKISKAFSDNCVSKEYIFHETRNKLSGSLKYFEHIRESILM